MLGDGVDGVGVGGVDEAVEKERLSLGRGELGVGDAAEDVSVDIDKEETRFVAGF